MTEVRVRPEDNPAVLKPEWIPETQFPELEELREEHMAVLADWHALGRQYRDVEQMFDDEDGRHAVVLEEAYRDGVDNPKLPKRTPQAERERKLADLRAQIAARKDHVRNLIAEVVDTVQQHGSAWCEQLRETEDGAYARVEAARRALAEAQAAAEATPKLRMWLERTAQNWKGWHIDWPSLNRPQPSLVEIANGYGRMITEPAPALAAGDGADEIDVNAIIPDYSEDIAADYASPEYQRLLAQTLDDYNRRQRPTESGELRP